MFNETVQEWPKHSSYQGSLERELWDEDKSTGPSAKGVMSLLLLVHVLLGRGPSTPSP